MINNVGIDSFAVRDLNLVGLLTSHEGLNVRLCTTSTVFSKSNLHTVPVTMSLSDESGIYILTLSTEEMEEVFEMSMTYGDISFTDCTVLYMAEKYCQPIITVEPRMRKTAEKLGIVVYDYEWLLQQMVDSGVIPMTTAMEKNHQLKTTVNQVMLRDSKAGISFRFQTAEEVRI